MYPVPYCCIIIISRDQICLGKFPRNSLKAPIVYQLMPYGLPRYERLRKEVLPTSFSFVHTFQLFIPVFEEAEIQIKCSPYHQVFVIFWPISFVFVLVFTPSLCFFLFHTDRQRDFTRKIYIEYQNYGLVEGDKVLFIQHSTQLARILANYRQ